MLVMRPQYMMEEVLLHIAQPLILASLSAI